MAKIKRRKRKGGTYHGGGGKAGIKDQRMKMLARCLKDTRRKHGGKIVTREVLRQDLLGYDLFNSNMENWVGELVTLGVKGGVFIRVLAKTGQYRVAEAGKILTLCQKGEGGDHDKDLGGAEREEDLLSAWDAFKHSVKPGGAARFAQILVNSEYFQTIGGPRTANVLKSLCEEAEPKVRYECELYLYTKLGLELSGVNQTDKKKEDLLKGEEKKQGMTVESFGKLPSMYESNFRLVHGIFMEYGYAVIEWKTVDLTKYVPSAAYTTLRKGLVDARKDGILLKTDPGGKVGNFYGFGKLVGSMIPEEWKEERHQAQAAKRLMAAGEVLNPPILNPPEGLVDTTPVVAPVAEVQESVVGDLPIAHVVKNTNEHVKEVARPAVQEEVQTVASVMETSKRDLELENARLRGELSAFKYMLENVAPLLGEHFVKGVAEAMKGFLKDNKNE